MRNRKGRLGSVIIVLVLIVLIGAVVYFYNSKLFEHKKPTITLNDSIYWNLKKPIPIQISDESGIKFVRVTLQDNNKTMVLANDTYDSKEKNITVNATLPKTVFLNQKTNLKLLVEVTDNSMWNFFMGNKVLKSAHVIIDTKNPLLHTLTNSYSIRKGGVGSVIFKADDPNLKSLYIQTNGGNIFIPTPFYKKGYYISLIAWDIDKKNFNAQIIATDKAGNKTQNSIKYYLLDKKYKTSNLKINDKFINGKITQLVQNYSSKDVSQISQKDKFVFINETLRQKNEEEISKATKPTTKNSIESFFLKSFYPLKNGAAVASFGDHRYYSYKNELISQSYHLGLDLASIAQADIRSSNDGVVVYAKENGIYGNNLIIDHGLGVYSLYGHCSSFNVHEGDIVKQGQVIAKTGATGLALGDHLHFSILVQGVEVRPEEWMDKKWFKNNITNVIEDAKKMIDKQ